MNHALTQLQPYPFEKLRALLGGVQTAADKRAIALSIVEPKHKSQDFVAQALTASLARPDPAWRAAVEACLARGSWDRTWAAMRRELFAAARRSAPAMPLSATLRRVDGASAELERRNV